MGVAPGKLSEIRGLGSKNHVADCSSTAYILISHGSRDPRPGQAMERLAQVVSGLIQRQQLMATAEAPAVKVALTHRIQAQTEATQLSHSGLTSPSHSQGQTAFNSSKGPHVPVPLVATSCLELSPVPLHQQVIDFSQRAAATGITTIRVVPLFLLKGVHVMEDIPHEIGQAQRALPDLSLEVCPYLGSHPGLKQMLQNKRQRAGNGALVLIAHGSRRTGGNAPIYALAEALGGTAAFWAVDPKLEDCAMQLIQAGRQQLTILPYFLFAGKITDALTQATKDLAERFPQITVHLLPPLGPTEPIANLVTDLALNQVNVNTQQSAFSRESSTVGH
jgi:sirohydrochlorin cobaltochelatase